MVNRPGSQAGGRSPAGGGQQSSTLPAPRKISYFNGDTIRAALLDEEAEKCARQLANVSNTQLRRFYEHVLNLQRRLELAEDKEKAWQELAPEFKMLKAKAVYAYKRPGNRFPLDFLQFFFDHTASVNNQRDFGAFCKHFQAVVGFHRFYAA
jgi:CRISPR-associated protein Csm2